MVQALNKENIHPECNKKFPKKKISILQHEEIDYFINNETIEFFDRFKLSKEFLDLDPSQWASDKEYMKNKEIMSNLRVVNDVAERAVKLVTDYNTCLTKNEEQKQFLFQVVAEYKRSTPDSKKGTMIKKFKKSDE